MANSIASVVRPVITALLVSPFESDHSVLRDVFSHSNWRLYEACNCDEALSLMLLPECIPVVICERDVGDGNWKDLLSACARIPHPPRLIVASRVADERLRAEVLNLGGHTVLATPFDAREVSAQVSLAWHSWYRQWRESRTVSGKAPRYQAVGTLA